MKRICIYCPTWESGGIEAFISNIIQHMDLSGLEIDIVVDKLKNSVFTEKVESLGIVFKELSGKQRAVFQNYRLLSKLMDERKYDVLHLNVFQALPMAYLLLAKQKGIPLRIAHSHNTMLRKSKTYHLKIAIHCLARLLFTKNATDLWSCSSIAAGFMFNKTQIREKKIQFIPNGIDLQRFQFCQEKRDTLRTKLKLENAFVIGNIGRLCEQKNQSFLLDVFAQIYRGEKLSRLLLVGEGDALVELKKKAVRLGISEHVTFYGTSEHVEELLWAMDVFAFPSRFEGLGIVAVEAQAAGLPVVCSEQVPEEAIVSYAIRLPLDKVDIWSEALIQQKGKRRIDISKNSELAKFDADKVAHWIEGRYRQGTDCIHG